MKEGRNSSGWNWAQFSKHWWSPHIPQHGLDPCPAEVKKAQCLLSRGACWLDGQRELQECTCFSVAVRSEDSVVYPKGTFCKTGLGSGVCGALREEADLGRSRRSEGCSVRLGCWTSRDVGSSLPHLQGLLHPSSTDDPVAHWPFLPHRNCSKNKGTSQLQKHSSFS